jgi:pimeloyl-ACP methyl ester carboxylesterase
MMSDGPVAEPTRVALDPNTLRDLASRLRSARLPRGAVQTWERGTPEPWLAELVDDWLAFDADTLQNLLDGQRHVQVNLDGVALHALVAPGRGPDPLPLLLTHGWPSSFLEYTKVLPLLTDPGAHGGSHDDAFTVVAPSLPGFGFSGPPPPSGFTHEQVAELWYRVMVDALGHRRFVAHGSDLGAGVTARLARAHPEAVAAIHLATPSLAQPPPPWSEAVTRHFAEVAEWTDREGAYGHLHSTKPSTIGAALDDSPLALAAWVGEKITAWSSPAADGGPGFPRDLLLSTLTLYWVTRTASTSLLPYWAYRHGGKALPADDPAPTPAAVDVFGGEVVPFPKPPREVAERYFNLSHWGEHDRGGHFPAVAEPSLLATRLREVFRPYR